MGGPMKTLDTLSSEIVVIVKMRIPSEYGDKVYCNISPVRKGFGDVHLIAIGVRFSASDRDEVVAQTNIGSDCALTEKLLADVIVPVSEVLANGLAYRAAGKLTADIGD